MPKPKGSPKSGGRQKGTANKLTEELRDRIRIFLEANFDTIQIDFQQLDPEKRAIVFEKFLKFVLPQVQISSVDLNIHKMTETEIDELLHTIIKRNNEKD